MNMQQRKLCCFYCFYKIVSIESTLTLIYQLRHCLDFPLFLSSFLFFLDW